GDKRLTRSVGAGNPGELELGVIDSSGNEQLAVVQGDRPDPDEHLARSRCGRGKLLEPQPLRTRKCMRSIRFRDLLPVGKVEEGGVLIVLAREYSIGLRVERYDVRLLS